MKSYKLKRCPFCGSEAAVMSSQFDSGPWGAGVYCTDVVDCGLDYTTNKGYLTEEEAKEAAMRRWNRREVTA